MANKVATRWLRVGIASLVGIAGLTGSGTPRLVAAVPVAQDAKAELEKKLAAIDKKDANALFAVALWAEQNNLKTDSKRLLRDVIKINTDHAEARALLGYEKFGDKWLTKREIDREKAKAEEAEKLAQGLKKWKNEWVPAADWEKLDKGQVAVEVDGEKKWVTPEQKERIEKGMTLFNGIWVTKEDMEHMRAGEFNVGGKWLKQAEADKAHADFTSPWVLESDYVELTTTCTYAFAQTALIHADASVKKAYELIGLPLPKTADFTKLKLVLVTAVDDYKQLGTNQAPDAFDASMSTEWSTFIMTDATTGRIGGVTQYESIPGAESNKQATETFSLGHVRFAAALTAVRSMTFVEPPSQWFFVGVASYCERYWNPIYPKDSGKIAKWTLDNLNSDGGLIGLKNYFEPFIAKHQTFLQAGLLVGYLTQCQTKAKKVDDQWKKCVEALKAPKNKDLEKCFLKLETVLGKDGDKELEAFAASISG